MEPLKRYFTRNNKRPQPLNEVLDKLSVDDVNIIKRNNLVIYAPSLAAMTILGVLQSNIESILRNNAPELEKQKLSSTEKLSLIVYYSYCLLYCSSYLR